MVYDIGKLTLTSGRCPLSLECTGWIIFIKILKILHIMHLLFSCYPIIFRNTFTLEPIYFINSKPDLAFKFRCCEFGFIKQIRKLNNITLYHGIKREGKFKIIVFEPQTRYLLEIWKCHEKNRRKNQQKKNLAERHQSVANVTLIVRHGA